MAFTYNGKEIEHVVYNTKSINITQYNGETILEDNVIYNANYTANPTITPLTGTFNLEFTSNNKEYTSIKATAEYLYYVNDTEETNVYSYTNSSWAELYKPITVKNKTFVDSTFYDWFNINYIKG